MTKPKYEHPRSKLVAAKKDSPSLKPVNGAASVTKPDTDLLALKHSNVENDFIASTYATAFVVFRCRHKPITK